MRITKHTLFLSRSWHLICPIFLVLFAATVEAVTFNYDSLNRLTNVDYGNGSAISYTYDAAGNRLTYSGAVANDTIAPNISITNPTSGWSFTNTSATINLSGTASDNTGVTLVTWQNYSGGIGVASGTNSWSITGIPLKTGANDIFVTAYDAAGNSTYATLTVTYFPPPVLRITSLTITSNTTAVLAGVGPAAGIVFIQTSTNLTRWQTIAILTNITGAFQFPYPISKSESKRFFRAMPPSAVSPSPQISGMGSSNRLFRFSLNGLWGDNYVVQASTNLTHWVSISTNAIPAGGFVVVVDPNSTNFSRRFYRAVVP
jgi:YD repeat-containing protein